MDYLQNPELLDILLHDLFGPTKNVNPLHKPKFFFVLAVAVCFEPGTSRKIDLRATQPTVDALKEAEIIARTNPFGSELQAALMKIRAIIEYSSSTTFSISPFPPLFLLAF